MDDNLSILLNSIQTMKTGIGNRFILGVDGLSRSGKTTFVNKLSHMLQEKNIPICVFHMDDYIVERNKRYGLYGLPEDRIGFLVKMNPLKGTLKNLETGIGRQKTII